MNRKGFTLIELLIVIAIIGILASVVLVGIGPAQRSGRDARRIADLRQIQNALELYKSANGQYPTGAGDVTGLGLAVTVPRDPRVGAAGAGPDYQYLPGLDSTAVTTGYLLLAVLEGDIPASAANVTGVPNMPDGSPYDFTPVSAIPITGCGQDGSGSADVYCIEL
jgi:prepilin-type N-terminal cleavage/methylation domain-containing protein